ncbi:MULTISPECIES: DUF4158 domain-containing protein [unclassified Streptomyces]|uniref:DUF4158 domain-containing protein n=1 Tax=unclassified Streptomyces TaxID=2593676 RepID=UPI00336AB97A
MPVEYLPVEQEGRFGRFAAEPSPGELEQFYRLDARVLELAAAKRRAATRRAATRLGWAVQWGTVRRLGTFLTEDPDAVPAVVVRFVAEQLGVDDAHYAEYGGGCSGGTSTRGRSGTPTATGLRGRVPPAARLRGRSPTPWPRTTGPWRLRMLGLVRLHGRDLGETPSPPRSEELNRTNASPGTHVVRHCCSSEGASLFFRCEPPDPPAEALL